MNIQGTNNADTLIGTLGDDILIGYLGADSLIGGEGIDAAEYAGLAEEYIIRQYDTYITLEDLNYIDGNEGIDTLTGIEFINFSDKSLRAWERVWLTVADMAAGSAIARNGLELGNTAATAQVLVPTFGLWKTQIAGSISTTSDRDLYRFELTGRNDIEVRLEGMSGNLSMRLWQDLNLDGIAQTGEQSYNYSSGTAHEYLHKSNGTAGVWYAEVWRPTGGGTGAYRLGIATTPSLPNAPSLALDLGDLSTTGMTWQHGAIALGAIGTATISGSSIGAAGNERWVKFSLTQEQQLDIALSFPDNYGNALIELFAASASGGVGNRVAIADNPNQPTELISTTLTPGSYYLKIFDGQGLSQSPFELIFNAQSLILPVLNVADISVTEGNNATFTLTLSEASSNFVSVNYTTIDGTAQTSDYVATSGTLTFAPGEISKTIIVPVQEDSAYELNETFSLMLANPSGVMLADAEAIATIIDNDNQPTITINNTSLVEGESGTTDAILTVTLSNPSYQTISVNYNTINQTAVSTSDYVATSGTLTFAPGESTKTIAVPVNGAAQGAEPDETFLVQLTNAVNATIADNTGIVTIINDDSSMWFSAGEYSIREDGVTIVPVTLERIGILNESIRARITFTNGTAIAPNDYNNTAIFVDLFAGETSKTVNIPIVEDALDEIDETFNLTLTGWNGLYLPGTRTTAIVTINDNEYGQFSFSSSTYAGSESGAQVTILRTGGADGAASVTLNLSNGTATAPGDYNNSPIVVNFAAGEISKNVSIPVVDDPLGEQPETINLSLNNPTGGAILGTQPTAILTINDNEQPVYNFSGANYSVTEGNTTGFTTNATIRINCTGNWAGAGSVQVQLNNGSPTATGGIVATTGVDYNNSTITVDFASGETFKDITIPIAGDATYEQNENIFLLLINPSSGSIGTPGTATLTIDNDDNLPTISINDLTVTEGNSGTSNATVTLSLSNPSYQNITVNYSTANNTAASGADYTAISGTATIAAGFTSTSINIPVLGDSLDEINESLFINLITPVNATIADNQGIVTITDDDTAPTISINDVSLTEGNSGTTNLTFTVTLSAISGQTVTVNYATANGTAISSSDYTSATGTLTFNPGETSKTINVPIIGDTLDETNENFTLNLSSATNAIIADASGTGTINDNDTTPSLTIDNVSVTETHSGTINAAFTVTLSAASGQTVSVNYATSNGTASAGSDYTAISGTLTFNPGETSKTINVPIIGEIVNESNETFIITLSNPINATLATTTATGTIVNDDIPATYNFSASTYSVNEGNASNTTNVVTIARTGDTTTSSSVQVGLASGSPPATAGSDFTTGPITINFAALETSKTVPIQLLGDGIYESNEAIALSLSSPSAGSAIGTTQPTATLTLLNDDPAPNYSFSAANYSVTEGNAGTSNATIRVNRMGNTAGAESVQIQLANGATNPATGGVDYNASPITINFAAGETFKDVSVPIIGDTIYELNETIALSLTNPSTGMVSGQTNAILTINNNDAPPSISINNATVTEGNTGTTNTNVIVSLSNSSYQTIGVNYSTANGTASAGSDYTTTSGTLTFAPGETSKIINVPIIGDTLDELDETFLINLSSPTNATLSDSQGIVIIQDNDTASLAVNDLAITENDSGTINAAFTVTLNAISSQTVTVNYNTSNSSATSGSDYTATSGTLTFNPGETSKTINIPIVGDTLDEFDEAFNLTISNAINATIADNIGVGTILDNDPLVQVSPPSYSMMEGNNSRVFEFLVTLSGISGKPITVNYATANATATSSSDYIATSGTLSFAPGETFKKIPVTIIGDVSPEVSEYFRISFTNPVNVLVNNNPGNIYLINDD